MRAKIGIRADEVRFEHVLFVEGDEDSFDIKVLSELLTDSQVIIRYLRTSSSIKSASDALIEHNPRYYFLVDRDQDRYSKEEIEKYWEDFSRHERWNFLVWRRREIENYFLEARYLCQSDYCCVEQSELEEKILRAAGERLLFDVANYVVTSLREELKTTGIENFSRLEDFSTKASALQELKSVQEALERHCSSILKVASYEAVERRFLERLDIMTGGSDELAFGCGDWINMIKGKKVLNKVIHSECFRVPSLDGGSVEGSDKLYEVARNILRKDYQPKDFLALKCLIKARIRNSAR